MRRASVVVRAAMALVAALVALPVALVALPLALVACGPGPAPADAGTDSGVDAGRDAGPPDAGPLCDTCDPGASCCGTPDAPECAELSSDLHHCGACGIDCVASARGDRCVTGQCGCGDFALGCIGSFSSHCCVPEDGVRDPYCANLAQDRTDCGACGNECPIAEASQCEGGRCVCGDARNGCAGTPEDTCCGDRGGLYSCVDTTTDREHCGACGNRCDAGLRCAAGTCVP